MQNNRDTDYQSAVGRAVREVILLSILFLVALFLFGVSVYYIASIEAGQGLQNRPRGLLIGWLATITIGLVLGRTRRQEDAALLPQSLVIVRESLQAVMLLLFFSVLCYASHFLYTSRRLILQRPWAMLIGWFAFLVFIAFFAKTRAAIRSARRK